jgi:hypothetical protein
VGEVEKTRSEITPPFRHRETEIFTVYGVFLNKDQAWKRLLTLLFIILLECFPGIQVSNVTKQ